MQTPSMLGGSVFCFLFLFLFFVFELCEFSMRGFVWDRNLSEVWIFFFFFCGTPINKSRKSKIGSSFLYIK
jgi:hypothetical protein